MLPSFHKYYVITFDIGAVRISRCPLLDAVWLAVARLPVIAQSTGADVLLLAAAALVWPFVGGHRFVQLEVIHSIEPLRTHIASKRLFSGVHHLVRLQAEGVRETLVANVARERPFASVHQPMTIEVVHMSEPLLANFAFKRPFARVEAQMRLQVR